MVAPEGVPLAAFAEVEGAEVADGVAAGRPPAHAAAAQSVADHRAAGAFHGARADLPAGGHVARVIHLVMVVAEVGGHAALSLADGLATAGQVERLQLGQHSCAAGVLELMTALVEPSLALRALLAKQ